MTLKRIQVLLDDEERARIKQEAVSEGTSMSGWIRRAAVEKVQARRGERRLRTVEDLESFFRRCDDREQGGER